MKTYSALCLVCCLLVGSFSFSYGQSTLRGVSVTGDALKLEREGNQMTLVWTGWIAFAKPTIDPLTVAVSYDITPPGPWNLKGGRVAMESSAKHAGAASVFEKIPIATLDASGAASPASLFKQDQAVNLTITVRPQSSIIPGFSLAQSSFLLKPLNYLLLYAASRGDIGEATELLDAGASVNSANLENKTALMMAAAHGHLAMVKLLIERGAAIDMRSKAGPFVTSAFGSSRPGGWTALSAAASNGNPAIVELLLERGATAREWADDQMSPLKAAVQGGNPVIVDLLLQRGADVNAVNDTGYSLLAMADINGRGAVARVLRKHGGRIVVPWDIVPRGR
jgi:hypothetical protein